MATTDDPSLLRGERTEPEGSQGTSRFTCSLHAYSGDQPCLHCIESGRTVEGVIFRPYVANGEPWVGHCPHCLNTDLRSYNSPTTNYTWCGHCGAKDQMIPEGVGL